ncbi:MAG: prepilin-type N-terminal cleavage/methylation domain-containing protein [Phycisphaerales bacterium]
MIRSHRASARRRRGFNLVELLMALAISSALLAATMVALNACFVAYQATTEEASTHTVARLVMHRLLTMIRTGADFGPLPDDPLDATSATDEISFRNTAGQLITIGFDETVHAITLRVEDGDEKPILRGVQRTVTSEGANVPAFTLEWDKGTHLYRVTMDLTVVGDDNQATKLDKGLVKPIRLVASSMPRTGEW